MIPDTPEMIAAMKQMGIQSTHVVRGRFAELKPRERLVLRSVIDMHPGVAPYECDIAVDFFFSRGDSVPMVVTLDAMHSAEFTRMQEQGFTSQLTKLDARFA